QNEQGLVDEAVPTLQEAAQRLERALGPRHPQCALVATMLATALLEQGRFSEAEAELDRARAIHAESVGSPPMPQFHVLAVRGELELRRRRWAAARGTFEEALGLAEPIVGATHPMLADMHFGLAHVEAAAGDRARALARAEPTLQRVEAALGDAHPYVARGWLHQGELQLDADDFDAATRSFERAKAINERATPPEPAAVAWAECWLGRTALASGEGAPALARLVACVDGLAAELPDGNRLRLEALLALASAQQQQGDGEGAAASLTTAETWMAATRSAEDPALAWVRLSLARLRYDAASTSEERTRIRREAQPLHARLAAEPGWVTEAESFDAWPSPASAPTPRP
ncbi:MAG: tetratricopeptide repeat protein, partial [Myxococcota bacterium]